MHPLFELIDCAQSPDVDGGASSPSVIACVLARARARTSLFQYADCKTFRDIV